MLEFTATTIEIKIGSNTYSMRVPTYKESIDYRANLKKIENDDEASFYALLDYFEKLGLPKEVTGGLQLDHLEQILEFIIKGKKK